MEAISALNTITWLTVLLIFVIALPFVAYRLQVFVAKAAGIAEDKSERLAKIRRIAGVGTGETAEAAPAGSPAGSSSGTPSGGSASSPAGGSAGGKEKGASRPKSKGS